MNMIRIFAVFIALSFLSACGFSPLYGQAHDGNAPARLAQVAIGNIPDREGQILRNSLIDRFYRDGRPADPAYTLDVDPLREDLTDLDVTKSADATRGQLRLSTRITLHDAKTGDTLLERNLTSITSYNILLSQFTTRVSENNARENAVEDLARQIEQQLALYFRRAP